MPERWKVLERLVSVGAMLQRMVSQELRRVLGQVDGLLLQVRAVQQQRGLRERNEEVRRLCSGKGKTDFSSFIVF